jgi:hypothetical protein
LSWDELDEVDPYVVVALERWNRGVDTTEMFAELPDGACQEQHWSYVIKGSITRPR